jgi:hypothetical protein
MYESRESTWFSSVSQLYSSMRLEADHGRYIKRKQEMDSLAEKARMAKNQSRPKDDDLFGEMIRKPLSPRVTVSSPAGRPT